MFEGLIAKFVASAVVKKGVGFVTMIPKPVWEAVAVLGYLLALFALHQHYAHAAIKAADQAGYSRARNEDAKIIAQLRARAATFDVNAVRITQEVRTKHDQDVQANAAAAAAVLVRGPGAAGCRSIIHPAVPAAASGDGAGHRQADAAVPQVPSGEGVELFGLPPDGAVSFARQNDDLIAEVKAWHAWYPLMAGEWAKLRKPIGNAAEIKHNR